MDWTDSGEEPFRYDGFDSFCRPANVKVTPRNRRSGRRAQDRGALAVEGRTVESLRDDSVNSLTVVTTPRTVVGRTWFEPSRSAAWSVSSRLPLTRPS